MNNTTLVYLGQSLTPPSVAQMREQQLAEVLSMLWIQWDPVLDGYYILSLHSGSIYKTLCLPLLLYGSELWTLTKMEITIPYSTAHALHSFCMFGIATTLQPPHNISYSPCTITCTPHPALLTPLPFTTLLCTQLTNTKHICVGRQSGTRCRNGGKCCGVIPI